MPRKPRIIIIGAGLAGLSAAHHLFCHQPSAFELTILEASNRVGGRICTSTFGGSRVELGATWIHGMEGSPLYKIAQDIGAMESSLPFERQDGFPDEPIVKAEGGLTVPTSIVGPIMDVYKKLLCQIRSHDKADTVPKAQSIGAFVSEGFNAFLSQQDNSTGLQDCLLDCLYSNGRLSWCNYTSHAWTLRSLQEALISMNEYMERVDTSADTLHDLDVHAEKEYADYPGDHVTIPGGYMRIIDELVAPLPNNLIHLGKKVEKIIWNHPSLGYPASVSCSDGSLYEADHVIITISLGVLKAGIKPAGTYSWASPEGRLVCRSVDDLELPTIAKHSKPISSSLFEPPLPPSKVEAISRLGYGLVNKVFLQLNTSALSPSQVQQLNSHIQLLYRRSDDLMRDMSIPSWMRKTFSITPIYNGSSVLLCWFAGNEALEMESLSDEEIMTGVAKTLASFRVARQSSSSVHGAPKVQARIAHESSCSSASDSEDSMSQEDLQSSTSSSDSEETYDEDDGDLCDSNDFRRMFVGVLRSKWGKDPLFRGSYSFVATGASGEDIEMLAKPLPYATSDSGCNRSNTGSAACDECDARRTKSDVWGNAVGVHGDLYAGRGHGDLNARNKDTMECSNACCNGAAPNCESEAVAPLQLLFAGEATVRTLYSTTHGAHLSGLREANRLLTHYGFSISPL